MHYHKHFVVGNILLLLIVLFLSYEPVKSQNFRLSSKDSANGRPEWFGYMQLKLKFNGIYDISGGLQGEHTFNLNKIDVWGNDNTPNLWMDLYQSQLRLFGSHEIGGHQAIGYFEADFWAGDNRMRMRMAYLQYKFFQVGQDWSFFGDKNIWPNVFDWDGPSSGIWRRDPLIRFFWNTESNWEFETGIELPGAQINFLDDLDTTFKNATGNPIPDVIAAVKKKFDGGHVRLSAIARFLPYKKSDDLLFENGYGASLSGFISTSKKYKNPIQFQFVYGYGIATYIVSFGGAQYDAVVNGYGDLKAVPAFGGWLSYELWLNKIFHVNFVAGITDFVSPKFRYAEVPEGGFNVVDGHVELDYYYGLINFMADPLKDFTVGVEFNIGSRNNQYFDIVNPINPLPDANDYHKQSRLATRISFGIFYNF
jgi:hypothetical protein